MLVAGRTSNSIPGVIRLGPTGSLEYLSEALGPAAQNELPACNGAVLRTHPDTPTGGVHLPADWLLAV